MQKGGWPAATVSASYGSRRTPGKRALTIIGMIAETEKMTVCPTKPARIQQPNQSGGPSPVSGPRGSKGWQTEL